eukprot:COSAG01_NODE_21737_length_884_cov_1.633249_1_plen_196_part_10
MSLDEQAAAEVLRMKSVDFSESEAPRVETGHPGPIFYDPQEVGEEFTYQTAETADALQELIGQGIVRPETQVYVSEWVRQWFLLEEKWEELGVDLSPASVCTPLPAQEPPIDALAQLGPRAGGWIGGRGPSGAPEGEQAHPRCASELEREAQEGRAMESLTSQEIPTGGGLRVAPISDTSQVGVVLKRQGPRATAI